MIMEPQVCGCPPADNGLSMVNSPICSGTILFMALVERLLWGQCQISEPCKRIRPVKRVRKEYDFIVVGAGAAGPVVASRLSEIKDFKVLLLEAGGPEPISCRAPSNYRTYLSKEGLDWMYYTQPENYCLDQNGKGCVWLRGKALGGTTIQNGMMYHRGHPADYDDWVEAGAKGWSWRENLPYFHMTEGNKEIGSVVSDKHHSSSGPMPIKRFNYQPQMVYDLLNAINETGLPIINELNDPTKAEGFAIAQAFNFNGQRYTSARAFLSPRPNLDVALHAHVSKVLTETVSAETRAVGVEYYDQNGRLRTVYASKEVILTAGALNTPQIMMLSGIGPEETLDKFNIPVIKDLPVGQNLRNHIGMFIYYMVTKIENTRTLDWTALLEYLASKTGPMSATGITQLSGVLYSSLGKRKRHQPDLQFFFNGFYAECSKTGEVGETIGDCASRGTNISANAVSLLPKSVGYLTLNSADPFDPPLFYPNYFSHPDDMVMVKEAARYIKKIFETDVMKNKFGVKLNPDYLAPCKHRITWSDEWIECMARQYTDPQNHQQGTASIGLVVDPQLRVYGIDNLRVADASAMPTLPTGNPEAVIMMVAERAAAFIKKEWL